MLGHPQVRITGLRRYLRKLLRIHFGGTQPSMTHPWGRAAADRGPGRARRQTVGEDLQAVEGLPHP